MRCDQALEALWTERSRSPAVEAHLRSCPSCSLAAERSAWLDRSLTAAILVAPPPAALARALAAARSAAPILPQPPARSEALVNYVLAGVVLVLATSVLAGWYGLVGRLAVEVAASLWLVVTSPALWLLPDPAEVWGTLLGWLGAGVLAWSARGLLLRREADDSSQPRQAGGSGQAIRR
jgi:hypothetical protein